MFTHKSLFRFLCLLVFCCASSAFVLAQDEAELPKPDFLTIRLFEARVAPNTNLSEQLFRMKTASQPNDEKWCANVQKAYPGAAISLLQTQHFRAFKSPRPSIINIGETTQAHQELNFLTALGFGENDKVVTMTIAEVNYYPTGKSRSSIPYAVASQSFESAPGMTYFFTRPEMKLTAQNYSRWFRGSNFVNSFATQDHYLIVSVSYDAEPSLGFLFDFDNAANLSQNAAKKINPQWPAEIKQNSLGGKIQVKAILAEDGKVENVTIWKSSLPEGNQAALTAAAQWEFPATALTGIKSPAVALISFAVPVPPTAMLAAAPAPEASQASASISKTEAQPAPQNTAPPAAPAKAQTKTPLKKTRRN